MPLAKDFSVVLGASLWGCRLQPSTYRVDLGLFGDFCRGPKAKGSPPWFSRRAAPSRPGTSQSCGRQVFRRQPLLLASVRARADGISSCTGLWPWPAEMREGQGHIRERRTR